MSHEAVLRVDGAVEQPLDLTFEAFSGFPEDQQVVDVSRFATKRPGDGVVLEAILGLVRPRPEADYLTLHADRDDFHVSIPLAAVRGEGIVVYKLSNGPLSVEKGGPFRFLIRDPAACHTAELDDCANVKFLSRIELSIQKGHDTRPQNEAEHAALHRNEHV